MARDPGVVVLGHDSASKVEVFGDVDLPSEHQETLLLCPFCASNRSSRSIQLETPSCLRNRFLQIGVTKTASYVSQNVLLLAYDAHPRQGMDTEQFRTQEGHITVVVGASTMIGASGERIGLTHGVPWTVAKYEVESREVQ
jgi:hypothetical protein